MITFLERLNEIKREDTSSNSKMIFLVNLKDTKMLEALVAWKSIKHQDVSLFQVNENETIESLWDMVEFDQKNYAITLGCQIPIATSRYRQLRNLNLIYPDGTIDANASAFINIYVKNQVNKIMPKQEKND